MRVSKLSKTTPIVEFLTKLNVTQEGVEILRDKSSLEYIYIRDLSSSGANILKQEALSVGADLAVPRGCVTSRLKVCRLSAISYSKADKATNKQAKKTTFWTKRVMTIL